MYLYRVVTTAAGQADRGAAGRSRGRRGTPAGAHPSGSGSAAAVRHLVQPARSSHDSQLWQRNFTILTTLNSLFNTTKL